LAYQRKTIRKAPEHVRPLMKIANELDVQLRRLMKAITSQIEIAEMYHEQEIMVRLLNHQLSEARQAVASSTKEYIQVDSPEELELEGMPDFGTRSAGNNTGCLCMGGWVDPSQCDHNGSDMQQGERV